MNKYIERWVINGVARVKVSDTETQINGNTIVSSPTTLMTDLVKHGDLLTIAGISSHWKFTVHRIVGGQ